MRRCVSFFVVFCVYLIHFLLGLSKERRGVATKNVWLQVSGEDDAMLCFLGHRTSGKTECVLATGNGVVSLVLRVLELDRHAPEQNRCTLT